MQSQFLDAFAQTNTKSKNFSRHERHTFVAFARFLSYLSKLKDKNRVKSLLKATCREANTTEKEMTR